MITKFASLSRAHVAIAKAVFLQCPEHLRPETLVRDDKTVVHFVWRSKGPAVDESGERLVGHSSAHAVVTVRFVWGAMRYTARVETIYPKGQARPDGLAAREAAANVAKALHGICTKWTVIPDTVAGWAA